MREYMSIVVKLLQDYRNNKIDLAEYISARESIMIRLKCSGSLTIDTKEESIEALQLKAYTLSAFPKSITNKISSPTEDASCEYLDNMNPRAEDVEKLEIALDRIKQLIRPLERDILAVEKMVGKLNDKRRFVIEYNYFKGYNMEEITAIFNQTHTIAMASKTLRGWRANAIYEMAREMKSWG